MSSAAIIVDMQRDFVEPSGRLPVPFAHDLDNRIRDYLDVHKLDLIVATRDWHPPNHISFKDHGGSFPMHCVAGTQGAEILPALDVKAEIIFSKGMDKDQEAFSGFSNPMLGPVLHRRIREFDTLFVVGVATEYCVKATALDAVQKYGFTNVVVPMHCIKGIDPTASLEALTEMQEAGVTIA